MTVIESSEKQKSRRPLPESLSIHRFASGKNGSSMAFQKKKKASRQRMINKAKLKKNYSKLLKREGIEVTQEKSIISRREKDKRLPKPDPFKEAKIENEKNKMEALERRREKDLKDKEQSEKKSSKLRRQILLNQKTKRGQPVMKNKIFDLLEKIKSGS